MRTCFARIKNNENICRLRERNPWEVRIVDNREKVEVLEEIASVIQEERKSNFWKGRGHFFL